MNREVVLEVKAEGVDKVTRQLQDLKDALNTPQFEIRNCENCTFNVYPSQTVIIEENDEPGGA